MATLDELMAKFGSAADADDDVQPTRRAAAHNPAVGDGSTKLASGGDTMNTLQDIYLKIAEQDLQKEASVAARAPQQDEETDVDFAKMAEQLAEAEADEQVADDAGGGEETDIIKVAAEYDSAGRIMARGFYDEFRKLAENTQAAENQNTESESAAKTPALGERGLPTVETNFAGSPDHDKAMETTGSAPKQNYLDSLKPPKTINAGVTGDDPEAAALSLGGGSPLGFATVRDLQA